MSTVEQHAATPADVLDATRELAPTIAARANAEKNGRAGEFDAAVEAFCEEWNRGSDDDALFRKEYLVAVGTRG